jgi:hypothetical protein
MRIYDKRSTIQIRCLKSLFRDYSCLWVVAGVVMMKTRSSFSLRRVFRHTGGDVTDNLRPLDRQ